MAPLTKLEADVEINALASQFQEIIQARPHHISNVSTSKVQSCELRKGEWGKVGSILYWKYVHDGKVSVAKSLIEAVDEKTNSVTWKVLEGDLLEHHKSFKMIIQCIPKDKGSVIHFTFECEKLHDEIPDPHSLLKLFAEVAKDIDAHLMGYSEDPLIAVEAAA